MTDEAQGTARPASVEDLKLLLRALADNGVEYLLIGGYALYALGYQRGTGAPPDAAIHGPSFAPPSGPRAGCCTRAEPAAFAGEGKPERFGRPWVRGQSHGKRHLTLAAR